MSPPTTSNFTCLGFSSNGNTKSVIRKKKSSFVRGYNNNASNSQTVKKHSVPTMPWVLGGLQTYASHDMTKPTKWVCAQRRLRSAWVFAVHSMAKLSSCGQRRLWSDWADAEADLTLRWAHSHFVGFVMSWLTYTTLATIRLNRLDKLWWEKMGRVKRIWCLSPMRATKVQAGLCIRAVSPEPPLLAHISSESRGTFRQKARSLAPLNGWACAVEIRHDGMLEDTNSLDAVQIILWQLGLSQNRTDSWTNTIQLSSSRCW